MAKRDQYKPDFICHGYITMSNHGGLEIELSPDGESARLRYYGKICRWQYIKRYPSGSPYVRHGTRKYKLDKFIRV